jgi:hypothetical protein
MPEFGAFLKFAIISSLHVQAMKRSKKMIIVGCVILIFHLLYTEELNNRN